MNNDTIYMDVNSLGMSAEKLIQFSKQADSIAETVRSIMRTVRSRTHASSDAAALSSIHSNVVNQAGKLEYYASISKDAGNAFFEAEQRVLREGNDDLIRFFYEKESSIGHIGEETAFRPTSFSAFSELPSFDEIQRVESYVSNPEGIGLFSSYSHALIASEEEIGIGGTLLLVTVKSFDTFEQTVTGIAKGRGTDGYDYERYRAALEMTVEKAANTQKFGEKQKELIEKILWWSTLGDGERASELLEGTIDTAKDVDHARMLDALFADHPDRDQLVASLRDDEKRKELVSAYQKKLMKELGMSEEAQEVFGKLFKISGDVGKALGYVDVAENLFEKIQFIMTDYGKNMEILRSLKELNGFADKALLDRIVDDMITEYDNKVLGTISSIYEEVVDKGYGKLVGAAANANPVIATVNAIDTSIDLIASVTGADSYAENLTEYMSLVDIANGADTAYDNAFDKLKSGDYLRQDITNFENAFLLSKETRIRQFELQQQLFEKKHAKLLKDNPEFAKLARGRYESIIECLKSNSLENPDTWISYDVRNNRIKGSGRF